MTIFLLDFYFYVSNVTLCFRALQNLEHISLNEGDKMAYSYLTLRYTGSKIHLPLGQAQVTVPTRSGHANILNDCCFYFVRAALNYLPAHYALHLDMLIRQTSGRLKAIDRVKSTNDML